MTAIARSNGMFIGISAAVFAGFTWSTNFVAPFLIDPYSIFDLAACRFLLSGLLGVAIICTRVELCRGLTWNDWLAAAGLGLIGYVGYFVAVAASAVYAGPVIPPAFLGLVPVILAICGNLRSSGIPWKSLLFPIGLALAGLLLVNGDGFYQIGRRSDNSLAIGIASSIGAVALWTWFGLANQSALLKRGQIDALVWTAMMMIGGSLQTLALLPIGNQMHLFNAPAIGLSVEIVTNLLLPGLFLAAVPSIGGAWAWTVASQRLPISLAGQLLTTEVVFAMCFGLMITARWPTATELLGATCLIVGVIIAVGMFYARRPVVHLDDDITIKQTGIV